MPTSRVLIAAVTILSIPVLCANSPIVTAQEREPLPADLAWLGLFNAELMQWLENENRLEQLCTAPKNSTDDDICRESRLAPKVAVIPVRALPQNDGARLGDLVLVALPGKGLKMFMSAGRSTTAFGPDLNSGDLGYGYFHQTILARHDTWFRVPLPTVGAAWIDARTWTDAPDVRVLEAGEAITTPLGDMFVLEVGKGVLRVRAEQGADMAMCQEGHEPPPKLEPWTEVRPPFDEIFDPAGHLLIAVKYTRGC